MNRSICTGALLAGSLGALTASAATINELRVDQPSGDNQEYFELAGLPGESLNDLTLIVIGDNNTALSGAIESVSSLAGFSIPSDGYFLAAETSFNGTPTAGFPSGSVDFDAGTSGLNFENSDNVSFFLVSGFTGASGDDLDTNDDGTLDTTPWTSVVDSVSLSEGIFPPDSGAEHTYSPTVVGPDGTFAPGHVYRFPNQTGSFEIGDFDGDPGGFQDTPGTANVPEPAAIGMLAIGGLIAFRRRGRN